MTQTTTTPSEYGVRIKDARKAAGLTQAEVAKRRGVKQCTVANHERGLNGISLEILLDYARAIGCDPTNLDASLAPIKPRRSKKSAQA